MYGASIYFFKEAVKEATFLTSLKKHLHEFISDAGSIAYLKNPAAITDSGISIYLIS